MADLLCGAACMMSIGLKREHVQKRWPAVVSSHLNNISLLNKVNLGTKHDLRDSRSVFKRSYSQYTDHKNSRQNSITLFPIPSQLSKSINPHVENNIKK